jgi:hypothetical protein
MLLKCCGPVGFFGFLGVSCRRRAWCPSYTYTYTYTYLYIYVFIMHWITYSIDGVYIYVCIYIHICHINIYIQIHLHIHTYIYIYLSYKYIWSLCVCAIYVHQSSFRHLSKHRRTFNDSPTPRTFNGLGPLLRIQDDQVHQVADI